MANSIDTALDALAGASYLGALVTSSVLKKVERRIINPLTEPSVPVLGIVPADAVRQIVTTGGTEYWHVGLLLMLCTRAKGVKSDESITELVGEVMGKLNAFNAAGASGGIAVGPRIDFWYQFQVSNNPVGAWMTATLKLEGPLKTP